MTTSLSEVPNTDYLMTLSTHVRSIALEMIYRAGSGHPGGALSASDLLTYLYFCVLRLDKENPQWPERDRFVLSKGHACAALYAVLGLRGCFGSRPTDTWLTFRQLNSTLQGHPHLKSLPWVEASTGSLGQGFSAAIGMALGLRYQHTPARVYVMLGDGELQEGEIWEGAMFAAHYHLDNLCAIVDYNEIQSDARIESVIRLEPLPLKWRAFGWNVIEIDGHDFQQINEAFQKAEAASGRPSCVIAHTIKGKGVRYMENSPLWHGSLMLSRNDLRLALEDLGASPRLVGANLDESVI